MAELAQRLYQVVEAIAGSGSQTMAGIVQQLDLLLESVLGRMSGNWMGTGDEVEDPAAYHLQLRGSGVRQWEGLS